MNNTPQVSVLVFTIGSPQGRHLLPVTVWCLLCVCVCGCVIDTNWMLLAIHWTVLASLRSDMRLTLFLPFFLLTFHCVVCHTRTHTLYTHTLLLPLNTESTIRGVEDKPYMQLVEMLQISDTLIHQFQYLFIKFTVICSSSSDFFFTPNLPFHLPYIKYNLYLPFFQSYISLIPVQAERVNKAVVFKLLHQLSTVLRLCKCCTYSPLYKIHLLEMWHTWYLCFTFRFSICGSQVSSSLHRPNPSKDTAHRSEPNSNCYQRRDSSTWRK